MFEITAYRTRTRDFQGSIFESDGTTRVVLAATDVVRFKAGRGTATPDIELRSGASTANGSTVTIENLNADPQYTVRLAQADLAALVAGIYDAEIMVVDDSATAPADAILHVESGSLILLDTLGGNIDLST